MWKIIDISTILISSYLLQCILANESQNCNCEILQIYNSENPSLYHNFSKQAGEINGKPFYFSIKSRMIHWSNLENRWMGNIYLKQYGVFGPIGPPHNDAIANLIEHNSSCLSFSSERNYNDVTKVKCLVDNFGKCFAIRQQKGEIQTGKTHLDTTHYEATAKAPCVFPFKYRNVTYYSCTTMDFGEFWCATLIDATTLKWRQWGYCNKSCPPTAAEIAG